MRPHVRRRTRVILVSVALSLTGVAGCSSSTTPDVETVAAAPTVAASQGAAQILATYKNFMTEYVKAYNTGDPNNPEFTSLGGGNAAGLQTVIQHADRPRHHRHRSADMVEAGRPVRRRERNDRVGDVLLRSGHLENRELAATAGAVAEHAGPRRDQPPTAPGLSGRRGRPVHGPDVVEPKHGRQVDRGPDQRAAGSALPHRACRTTTLPHQVVVPLRRA